MTNYCERLVGRLCNVCLCNAGVPGYLVGCRTSAAVAKRERALAERHELVERAVTALSTSLPLSLEMVLRDLLAEVREAPLRASDDTPRHNPDAPSAAARSQT